MGLSLYDVETWLPLDDLMDWTYMIGLDFCGLLELYMYFLIDSMILCFLHVIVREYDWIGSIECHAIAVISWESKLN